MRVDRIGRVAAAFSLSTVFGACGSSSATGGPHFDAKAKSVACQANTDATHCFELAIRNVGPDRGGGECWVAAIENAETELARSEPVTVRDVEVGEEVLRSVQMEFSDVSEDVGFPAHCDPGPNA